MCCYPWKNQVCVSLLHRFRTVTPHSISTETWSWIFDCTCFLFSMSTNIFLNVTSLSFPTLSFRPSLFVHSLSGTYDSSKGTSPTTRLYSLWEQESSCKGKHPPSANNSPLLLTVDQGHPSTDGIYKAKNQYQLKPNLNWQKVTNLYQTNPISCLLQG